jgi:hypothetical protein
MVGRGGGYRQRGESHRPPKPHSQTPALHLLTCASDADMYGSCELLGPKCTNSSSSARGRTMPGRGGTSLRRRRASPAIRQFGGSRWLIRKVNDEPFNHVCSDPRERARGVPSSCAALSAAKFPCGRARCSDDRPRYICGAKQLTAAKMRRPFE